VTRKLPSDSFEAYLALGEQRSYSTVAKQFGVSKRAVTKRASQEGWTARLAKIEADARVITDQRATQTLADMNERHLTMIKAIGLRAITALKSSQITDAMDAVRAAEIAIKLERLLAGEVNKRTELNSDEITRHEIRTLLRVEHVDERPRIVEAVAIGASSEDDDDTEDSA
jgi:hypothetical protein